MSLECRRKQSGADGTRKRRLSEIAGENEQVARQPDSEIRASSDDNPATSGAVIDCVIDSRAAPDVVEVALADALRRASEAGAWETVGQLARELEARRRARSGVVELGVERERRKR
jgi:hypothetical protein